MWVHGTVFTTDNIWKDSPPGWLRDIKFDVAALTTTGGHVWNAAYRLFHYFEYSWTDIVSHFPLVDDTPSEKHIVIPNPIRRSRPLKVLELGSGCGWLGMALARNLTQDISRLCMTEQVMGGALEWLDHNIKLNRDGGIPLSNVDTCACDWNDYIGLLQNRKDLVFSEVNRNDPCLNSSSGNDIDTSLSSVEWDLIIGSDLVYNTAGTMMLPRVMRALCTPKTLIYYAHTKRRIEPYDMDFFEELEKFGFDCREVREEGVSTPPPSPPPLSDLFPWMRIAVYLITLKK